MTFLVDGTQYMLNISTQISKDKVFQPIGLKEFSAIYSIKLTRIQNTCENHVHFEDMQV
jgi:hypothetical protein